MESVKTQNEKKKEYLWQYREAVRAINRIESELEEIRLMKMGVSVVNDGMPHAHGGGDLSGYAARLDDLERSLMNKRYHRVRYYSEIVNTIDSVKRNKERDVLFYRYIKGMDWWEIAEKMNFSERQIYRIHGKALGHLEILKDVSECQ